MAPHSSNPLLHWDPAADDPGQRRIHPLLRGAVLTRDHWTCRYCGAEAAEVDHVEPWARGGSTTPANLVAACRSCNREKGLRTPGEWRRDEAIEKLKERAGDGPTRPRRAKPAIGRRRPTRRR